MAKPARKLYGGVNYISADIAYTDTTSNAVEIGTVPAGALVLKPISGLQVDTAFNAGTSNAVDIGVSSNDDLYATDIAAGAIAFVPLDEAVALKMTADTTFYATYVPSGTAATAGAGTVVIAYIPQVE